MQVWVISAGDGTHGFGVVSVSAAVRPPREAIIAAMKEKFLHHGGPKPEDLWEWKVVSPNEVWVYSTSTVFAKRYHVAP